MLSETLPLKELIVHRKNVLKEIIEAFKSKDILSYNLTLKTINEIGELKVGIGSGVVREVMCTY